MGRQCWVHAKGICGWVECIYAAPQSIALLRLVPMSNALIVVQVLNPATGEPFIEMLSCSTKETEDAIAKAAEAFKSWRKRTADERAQFLLKWKQVCTSLHRRVTQRQRMRRVVLSRQFKLGVKA